MSETTFAEGLISHPVEWLLVAALTAVVYLYKQSVDQNKTSIQQLADHHKYVVDMLLEQNKLHRETLLRIVPLTERLVESLELLEKLTRSTDK